MLLSYYIINSLYLVDNIEIDISILSYENTEVYIVLVSYYTVGITENLGLATRDPSRTYWD